MGQRSNLGRFARPELKASIRFIGETQALFGASLAVERGRAAPLGHALGKTTSCCARSWPTRPKRGCDPLRRPRRRRAVLLTTLRAPGSGVLITGGCVRRSLSRATSTLRRNGHEVPQLDGQGDLRNLLAAGISDDPRLREPLRRRNATVAIARALIGSPGSRLFDEPSQGLAPRNRRRRAGHDPPAAEQRRRLARGRTERRDRIIGRRRCRR